MEDIFDMRGIQWVSEEPINLKEYFEHYSNTLTASSLSGSKLGTQEALRKCFPPPPQDGREDPFDLKTLEAACRPDLLTVPNELESQAASDGPILQSGRASNWYIGTFKDSYIPVEGTNTLHTLKSLAADHKRRVDIAGYAKLRNKNLKYFNTVRLVKKDKPVAGPPPGTKKGATANANDFVVNVRVYKPYHRKMYGNKFSSVFPKHSQELLMLGSQKLTELRDNIVCINNLAVGKDLSHCLDHQKEIPSASKEFPSAFMYINGTFYNDMRSSDAKDYSEVIKKWAEQRTEIGPLTSRRMENTYLKDVELRLGYPYVFLHVGNCEHILMFTDARLLHEEDEQNVSCYPISWGQPIKLAARCHLCNLNLAVWIAAGDPRLPMEYSLMCDRCLKAFCYNKQRKKEKTLRVYPFMDEFVVQKDMKM